MPYIITTETPSPLDHQGVGPSVDRRAVASLDEAADAIERIADAWLDSVPEGSDDPLQTHRQYRTIIEAWHSWDEAGGSIGPLPDGTVIVVEPIGFGTLASRAGFAQFSDERSSAEIIDAFNAAQD